jgi:hypothetical protein
MAGIKGHSGGRREGAGRPPDPFKVGRMIRVREITPDGKFVGVARAVKIVEKNRKRITLEDENGRIVLLF